MNVNLGMLFAYWLKNNRGMSYDDYVDRYKTDKQFQSEVNKQEDINEYKIIKER
jgi:hypothetical protein